MSITITNLTLSATYSKTQLETNFSDIANKFGAINSSDLASNAGVTPGQLSASNIEVHYILSVKANDLAAGWPAINTVVFEVPVPGSNGDTAWLIRDISWVCTDTGAGVGQARIEQGARDAVGAWVGTQVGSTITMTNANAANDANDGKSDENISVSFAYTAANKSLALVSNLVDATTLTAVGSHMTVSVRMTRVLQLS